MLPTKSAALDWVEMADRLRAIAEALKQHPANPPISAKAINGFCKEITWIAASVRGEKQQS
jgi:hypothetical protein